MNLNKLIKECDIIINTKKNNSIKFSTGDGMVIGFLFDQQLPLKLAIQLHKKIKKYNKSKNPSEILQVRIGLHTGNVYIVKDINNQIVMWGSGIVLAKRVMDLGDANHILLTERIAKDLLEVSDEYHSILKEIENFVIKHDQVISVYLAYGKDFGNSAIPEVGIKQGITKEIAKINKNILYQYAIVKAQIKNSKNMLVKYSRMYEIINKSNLPISEIVHGIGTDIHTNLEDLKIIVYDENKKPLKINRVLLDYPFQKEFTTIFRKPVHQNEIGRKYTLEYEAKEPERYYENNFMVNIPLFEVVFLCPSNSKFHPKLYKFFPHSNKKLPILSPFIKKHKKTIVYSWKIKDNSRGETLRLEW